MHPALRVHDVADGIVGAAHGEAGFLEILLQRLNLGGIVEQEFHVIAAGEAQMATAVLIRQVGEKAKGLNAQEARGTRPDRVELLTGLRDVAEYAGSERFMILPLAIIPFNDRGEELLIIAAGPISVIRFGLGWIVFPSSHLLGDFLTGVALNFSSAPADLKVGATPPWS